MLLFLHVCIACLAYFEEFKGHVSEKIEGFKHFTYFRRSKSNIYCVEKYNTKMD
jgi:hypothetical protein